MLFKERIGDQRLNIRQENRAKTQNNPENISSTSRRNKGNMWVYTDHFKSAPTLKMKDFLSSSHPKVFTPTHTFDQTLI